MKRIILSFTLLLSTSAFAEKMGQEATEMYSLMSHPQVQECLKNFPVKLVNLEIEKTVFRCPGCVEYKITGHEVNIDIAKPEKTIILIKGKLIPGSFTGLLENYECSIKNI